MFGECDLCGDDDCECEEQLEMEECKCCGEVKNKSDMELLSVWNCFGSRYFCGKGCASMFAIKMSGKSN